MRALVSLCVLAVIAGCAMGGVDYRQFAEKSPPPGVGATRLLLFRAADGLQYSARDAALRIDDQEPVDLPMGAFHSAVVAPGTHHIVVDMWDVAGRCELNVEAKGGTERYFEIAPRPTNALAMLPSALIPIKSLGGLIASGAAMMGGLSAESAGKVCGGAFQVVERSADQAHPRLLALRAAR